MNKLKKFYIIILLLVIFSNCKKNETGTISKNLDVPVQIWAFSCDQIETSGEIIADYSYLLEEHEDVYILTIDGYQLFEKVVVNLEQHENGYDVVFLKSLKSFSIFQENQTILTVNNLKNDFILIKVNSFVSQKMLEIKIKSRSTPRFCETDSVRDE
ncbi:MAG: hypothetical protein JXR63_10215 [Spirochaetales bacterium]|nr:hypothetical protein [Spirochaetales bacterium]